VTGVTWYEAAAYAEFRGKSLPTVFQWELAARDGKSTVLWEAVMPWGFSGPHENVADRANVNGTGTAPVESYEFGISPYGCYHMAGNVTEWCLNERPNGFTTAGGSWREGPHFFGLLGQYPGFYSIESLGFRCVLNSAEARGDQGGMFLKDKDQIPEFHPVDDDAFQAILRHYRYDDSPLDAKIVESVETSDWRREKFTYRGAGGRRALAYLYLPHGAARPLQMINYKPGGAVYAGLFVPQEVEVVCAPFIKSGRAVLVAVLEGMRERDYPAGYEEPKPTSVRFREVQVADTIDERRAIDYVASRGDIDINHVACMGLSMGGFDIVSMAVENRYQSILLLSAGLNTDLSTAIPEANPVNFAPQITVPKLMIHGRYDEGAPFRTTAQPLFNLFREPKELRALDTGHFPPMDLWVPIAQEWFDKKLGAVTKR
jgi:dienelactone hydrolase